MLGVLGERRILYLPEVVFEHFNHVTNEAGVRQYFSEPATLAVDAAVFDQRVGERKELVIRRIVDDAIGLGPLEPLLRDVTISDILVNTYKHVFVERNGVLERVPTSFQDDKHLLRVIDRIVSGVGRRVDEREGAPDEQDARDGHAPAHHGFRVHPVPGVLGQWPLDRLLLEQERQQHLAARSLAKTGFGCNVQQRRCHRPVIFCFSSARNWFDAGMDQRHREYKRLQASDHRLHNRGSRSRDTTAFQLHNSFSEFYRNRNKQQP